MRTGSSSEQPARSYLHPGGNAAQDLRPGSHQAVFTAGWVYIELQMWLLPCSPAEEPGRTAHSAHPACQTTFNLNPKACRMAISMLERRFLEFNNCCQIQLAPGSQSRAGIFPGSLVPRDLCTGSARTSTGRWGWSQASQAEANLKLTMKVPSTFGETCFQGWGAQQCKGRHL